MVYNEQNGGWFFGSDNFTMSSNSYQFEKDTSWIHMVYTYKNNDFRMYRNGVLFYTDSNYTNKIFQNGTFISIGMRHKWGANNYINATIDDVSIWDRALTQEKITALYNANSGAIVSVDAPDSVKQNDTLEIAINTSELKSSEDIISYQTKLSYDTTLLSYLSHSLNGTIINGGSTLVNANTNGLLKISHMNSAAITRAGSLIKLKFLANSKLGQAAFAMSNFLFNTSAVSQLINDTTEIIDGVPPTAKISLSAINLRKGDSLIITATFNEKMATSPLPQLSISGANNLANTNMTMINDSLYTYTHLVEKGDGAASIKLHTGTDLAGNILVENPTEGQNFTVLPTVYGDIDTNKFIQAYDAALALKYSVNLNPIPNIDSLPWSNWRKVVSNVDTVGGITANDASLILQYSAELIKSFPADASLRGLGNSTAEVIISKEADKLVFRAKGNLFGFNLYVKENFAALGKPTVLDNNMIVATNINDQNYAIGLATAYEPAEEAVFMTIPISTNAPANLLFDMIINTENAQQSISTISGIFENKAKGLNIFPNPTKDVVNINQAMGYTLRIVDFSGKEVFNQLVNNNKYEVSLKQLGSKGVYLITLSNENQQLISSQKIVLE